MFHKTYCLLTTSKYSSKYNKDSISFLFSKLNVKLTEIGNICKVYWGGTNYHVLTL